jgi:hypothetical protein
MRFFSAKDSVRILRKYFMRKPVTVHLIQAQNKRGIVARRVGNIIHPVGNHFN